MMGVEVGNSEKKHFLIAGGRIPDMAKQKNRSDIIESHDRHVSQKAMGSIPSPIYLWK